MAQHVTRILLAEDNEAVRKGIKRLLNNVADIEVVGEAGNGIETLQLVDQLLPDILMLDVEMPQLNGIEVARRMKRRKHKTRILVLSAYDDPGYIREMLRIGAAGYLIKDEAPKRILEAVRGVAQGQVGWVSPQIKARLEKKK
jgi:two-component system, NarL family, nitrate/nitrite response regulator NarL